MPRTRAQGQEAKDRIEKSGGATTKHKKTQNKRGRLARKKRKTEIRMDRFS
jgi:hypothetical protein